METIRGKTSLTMDSTELHARLANYKRISLDLGTGDGKFAFCHAQNFPSHFFIGMDSCRENLHTYDREHRRLCPERLRFYANQRRHHEWDVAILVDQSGSMAESVVYSSVMAAIFASLDVLRTRLLFFDTEIVDMTPQLSDPVEILFTAQLGGGTDINRAVAYAQRNFIERPDKTLFILITDLFEGGAREELLGRMRQLVESRVRALCLLALSDSGKPSYDHDTARELTQLGVPCFGCTPKLLIDVVERVLRGQDLAPLLARAEERQRPIGDNP